MGLIIFLIILAILLGGLGFVVHWLWIGFLIVVGLAFFSYLAHKAEGD